MDNYIQVEDGDEPYYLPVENNDTVILETVQSAFPRCCGLCFYVKNKCFVVTLQRGIFHLPKEYWKFVYEPIYDDDYDDWDEDEDEYDDGYQYDDYKNNVGAKTAQKEDINQLYYDLLKNDNVDDGDNDDLYSDDEQ